jgi:CDP-6-deoxy-D-xylo-4-hexulose-3-dehydrase
MPATDKASIRKQILELVSQYAALSYAPREFVPGQTPIPASGKVIGEAELVNMVDASLDGWLTTGRFNTAFEERLADFVGTRYALTTNSGSSANLLAFSALTSPQLGERALKPGDEVITVAAGFPTTVNPMLLYGMVPVFVDIHIPTYNIDATLIEAAVGERTRAIMIAHTLGNPFDIAEVMRIAKKYNLWVIEDCCDALGAIYALPGEQPRHVGTFGHLATVSFYPAHHITMGEGGAVLTSDPDLNRIVESFRDWGRDCYCAPAKENTCGKRFGWQLGSLPHGYDHKYTYSHLGFNLKISDMQAACGLAQIERLPGFVAARRLNFEYLRERLKSLEEFLILPAATPQSDPSWFGFTVTLRETARVSRADLQQYLEQRRIGTRLLFAGNLTRQPYFEGRRYRVSGNLNRSDTAMNNTFWVGIYPGLGERSLNYLAQQMELFFGVNF